MVWAPVIKASGEPLWIERGGIFAPAWADDPCDEDCCPTTCACLSAATGLDLCLSGFPHCIHTATEVIFGAGCGGTHEVDCECESFADNLNDCWFLPVVFADDSSAQFAIALGTLNDPDDRGVLVQVAECVDVSPDDHHPISCYIYALHATVTCQLSGGVAQYRLTVVSGTLQAFSVDGDPIACSACIPSTALCWGGFPFTTPVIKSSCNSQQSITGTYIDPCQTVGVTATGDLVF